MYLFEISILYLYLIISGYFLNFYFNIKFQKTFLFSIILLNLIIYFIYQQNQIHLIDKIIYLLIIIYFSLLIVKIKKIKINKNIILFSFIYFVIAIICYERYFLDHDEFSYWGKYIKSIFVLKESFYSNYKIDPYVTVFENLENTVVPNTWRIHLNQTINTYHKPLNPIYQFSIMQKSGYREDLAIFANNVVLISSFLFILKDSFKINKIIILFFLYYSLLNCLSFGFVSIYIDPILCSVFFVCIYYSYKNFSSGTVNIDKILALVLILTYLTLIHRSGLIYTLYILLFIFYLRVNLYYPKYNLIILLVTIISIPLIYELYNIRNNYLFDFFNVINSYLYFSEFGTIFKYLLNYFEISRDNNFSLKIYLIFWIGLVGLNLLFFRYKNILYFFIILIFLHTFIILILKVYNINPLNLVSSDEVFSEYQIHLQHLPRYFSVIIFSFLFFIIVTKIESFKTISLFILIFFIFLIIPLKAIGFFLPQNIYNIKKDNLEFFKIRKDLKIKASYFKNNYDEFDYRNNILITTRDRVSELIDHNSIFEEILIYEVFPLAYNYLYPNELKKYLDEHKMLLSNQNYIILNSNSKKDKEVVNHILKNEKN